jgi:16S rRNA (cytidine1402-2'-O)-methyltransferase
MPSKNDETPNPLKAALYILPSSISSDGVNLFNSEYYFNYFSGIKHYVCENEKAFRAFFKSIGTPVPQSDLVLLPIGKNRLDSKELSLFFDNNKHLPIGLVSDAGLPCVADPGSVVVKMAHNKGIEVKPITGPSSIFLSLMASGVNGQNFAFNGYLPIKENERKLALLKLQNKVLKEGQTQIFIETPYRSDQMLASMLKYLNSNLTISVSSDLMSSDESNSSMTVANWKKSNVVLGKVPCVFVIGTN